MGDLSNTYVYYRWWAQRVGVQYLSQEQKTRFFVKMIVNCRDDKWFVAAARKMNGLKDQKRANLLARLIGRKGERMVADALERDGYSIVVRPSEELYPKYGTSTSGYDIVAQRDQLRLTIEVKSLQEDCPLFVIGPKAFKSISRADTDVLALVKGERIYWALVSELKFLDPIVVHDAIDYPEEKRMTFLHVIDPMCLKSGI